MLFVCVPHHGMLEAYTIFPLEGDIQPMGIEKLISNENAERNAIQNTPSSISHDAVSQSFYTSDTPQSSSSAHKREVSLPPITTLQDAPKKYGLEHNPRLDAIYEKYGVGIRDNLSTLSKEVEKKIGASTHTKALLYAKLLSHESKQDEHKDVLSNLRQKDIPIYTDLRQAAITYANEAKKIEDQQS